MAEKLSMFVDLTLCVGCRGCQTACKSWNQLPGEKTSYYAGLQTMPDTTPHTYNLIKFKETEENGKIEWFFFKRQCMHCTEAACIKACPENALSHTETGAVVRDYDKCIGCGYCARYCPFGIPKVDEGAQKMGKCTLCFDRVAEGLTPACSKTCSPGAVQFGERSQLLSQARTRLEEVKQQYPDANLYGLEEQFLGGTNVFYLLPKSPEFYDLPKQPAVPAILTTWKDVIQPVGKALPLAALGAVAVSAFLTRVRENGHSVDKGGKSHGA